LDSTYCLSTGRGFQLVELPAVKVQGLSTSRAYEVVVVFHICIEPGFLMVCSQGGYNAYI